jgi:enamine deaminase RidA (YjgF/YER057c/UK114 family)
MALFHRHAAWRRPVPHSMRRNDIVSKFPAPSVCAILAVLTASDLFTPGPATAQEAKEIVRTAIPNSNFPISLAVRVPAGVETIYFSGLTPTVTNRDAPKDSVAAYGNTETQANSVFERLGAALKSEGLGFGDVVALHVYLVGDPAKEGKLDFSGLQAAYAKYFATTEQPNKPARTTLQVAALVSTGVLVEIEATAAKSR